MANSPDENVSSENDGVAEVIEYSNREDRQLPPFLKKKIGTDVVKIHFHCQPNVYKTLKKNSSEPACGLEKASHFEKNL